MCTCGHAIDEHDASGCERCRENSGPPCRENRESILHAAIERERSDFETRLIVVDPSKPDPKR